MSQLNKWKWRKCSLCSCPECASYKEMVWYISKLPSFRHLVGDQSSDFNGLIFETIAIVYCSSTSFCLQHFLKCRATLHLRQSFLPTFQRGKGQSWIKNGWFFSKFPSNLRHQVCASYFPHLLTSHQLLSTLLFLSADLIYFIK